MIPPNEEVNAINIKEVAKAAGVSVATISRVLNHPEQVQPETKTHVLAVMESLNYRPNWFARGLNLGKTGTIALLVPNIESRRYREILSGVETVALKKQHIVMLCNTHADPEQEAEYLKMVVSRQVDGVIVASSMLAPAQLTTLIGPDQPWVHIGPGMGEACRNLCYINYEEGAYQMTTHLIKMGQTEIALLLDEAPLTEMKQVTEGYRRALREQLPGAGECILTEQDSPRGGFLITQRLLQVLTGGQSQALEESSVVCAHDLFPSDTMQLEREHVMAFVTELGSHVSHSAILARTMGIPAVVGVGGLVEALRLHEKDTQQADGASPRKEETAHEK